MEFIDGMIRLSMDDCNNPNLLQLMRHISSAFDNIHYEYTFIFNSLSQKVIFSSSSFGALIPINIDFTGKSISSLLEYISGSDAEKFNDILYHIDSFYKRTIKSQRYKLQFLTDLRFKPGEHRSNATYKISPLTEDENGNPIHYVCSVGVSVYELTDIVCAVNILTSERHLLRLGDGVWKELKDIKLSPLESSIICYTAKGLTTKEIADKLCKAPDTIKSAKERICQKLRVDNMSQAVMSATNYRII